MKPGLFANAVVAAIAIVPSVAQSEGETINIPGTLELVDKPPAAISAEYLNVTIHQLPAGRQYSANLNRDGNFRLNDVPPGRYSLNLGFPGRIRSFESGTKPLKPESFDVTAEETGPLRIVVSLKTSVLSVEVMGLPVNRENVIALLSPADNYLTIRDSSILNPVAGNGTQFRFVPPGRYTLAVVDSDFRMALAGSAVVRDALGDKITAVEVREDGETKVTADYISPDAVKQAISEAERAK